MPERFSSSSIPSDNTRSLKWASMLAVALLVGCDANETNRGNGLGIGGAATDGGSHGGGVAGAASVDRLRSHVEPACSSRPTVIAGVTGLLAPASGVLHCAGQRESDFAEYYAAVPVGSKPSVYMTYWGLRNWGSDARTFAASVAADLERYPDFTSVQVGLSMTSDGNPAAHYEQDVAAGNLDRELNSFLDALESLARPVYLRIGYEFNGLSWNGYSPATYRAAFVRITELIRARRLEIATVWDASAAGVSNVMDYYPGDEVVDWWGINVYHASEFGSGLVTTFLAEAVARSKPVMIGESSAATVGTAGGQSSYDGWFAPYFALIAAHPEIKMFCYINTDWTSYPEFPQWAPWGDCRIQMSPELVSLYGAELGAARYLHATSETEHRSRFGIVDATPPGAVTGLRSGSGFAPQILWDCAPESDAVSGYLVERDGVIAARTIEGSYLDGSLRAGQTATYRVSAIDFAGNVSAPSDPLVVTMPMPLQRITNADFEYGVADWGLLLLNGGAATLDTVVDPARGNVARVTVTNSTGTNWHVQLAQPLVLRAGMAHRIHLFAKADLPTTVDVFLQQIAAPYATYFNQSLPLTDSWQELSLPAGTVSASEPSRLSLMMGAAGKTTIYLDDFTLEESTP